ncbi:MAG: hypothetical protein V4654_06045 [Bdellovibrionota bacterium]
MPQDQTNKSQISRRGQMNKTDMAKTTPASRPRDDLRTAYGGDENRGPASDQKPKSAKSHKVKGRRLPADSAKTPIR